MGQRRAGCFKRIHFGKTGCQGIIQGVSSLEDLPEVAQNKATELAPLANNRKNFGHQKEMLYGENAAINLSHGPAHMLKNSKDFKE